MYHLGDIRKLVAVKNDKLDQFLRPTNRGIVFFSTQGLRAPADMMAGGDYDGKLSYKELLLLLFMLLITNDVLSLHLILTVAPLFLQVICSW